MQLLPLHSAHDALPDGCVASIGNFDGVHLGHRTVLDTLARRARDYGIPSVAIGFEPLPREYFGRGDYRLTRFRERFAAISAAGAAYNLNLRFGPRLAGMSARDFIDQILVKKLGIRHLVVGDDFRFGKNREGGFSLLAEAGARVGFEVEAVASFTIDGERVSSTGIRSALKSGRLHEAERLLGRHYSVCGRVRADNQRGRSIGFPTANLAFGRRLPPLSGVFAARVELETGAVLDAVCNAGTRPTVDGSQYRIEAHLFDFDGNIYGQRIRIEFLKRIRDEKRFASFEELRAQIEFDSKMARTHLLEIKK